MLIENVETFSGAARSSPLVLGRAKHGVVDVSQATNFSSEKLDWLENKGAARTALPVTASACAGIPMQLGGLFRSPAGSEKVEDTSGAVNR